MGRDELLRPVQPHPDIGGPEAGAGDAEVGQHTPALSVRPQPGPAGAAGRHHHRPGRDTATLAGLLEHGRAIFEPDPARAAVQGHALILQTLQPGPQQG